MKRAADIANQTMLRAALPNAYQCGRCGHGPVLHANCSNLSAHHGEILSVRGSRLRRSNACAKCGWFAADISSWPRWDGSFAGDDNSELNTGKMSPGFLSVLSRSLWRNSWRVETLINYGIGLALGFFLSSRAFSWTCSLLSWMWWLLCLVPGCAWRWACSVISWMCCLVSVVRLPYALFLGCWQILMMTVRTLYTSVKLIYNTKEAVSASVAILLLFWCGFKLHQWAQGKLRKGQLCQRTKQEKWERQGRRDRLERKVRRSMEVQHNQTIRMKKDALLISRTVKVAPPTMRKQRTGLR